MCEHRSHSSVHHESGTQSLSCSDCGYDLSGTAVGGACPECGLPVYESLRQHVRREDRARSDARNVAEEVGVSGKACIAVLLGLLSPLVCSVLSPFAILFSCYALNDRLLDREDQGLSRSLAYAGLILGGIGMILLGFTIAGRSFGIVWMLWS